MYKLRYILEIIDILPDILGYVIVRYVGAMGSPL